jgi:hypothetical protein
MQKVEVNQQNYQRCCAITCEIDYCLKKIGKDTGMMSTPQSMLEHPHYKLLKEMGTRIIPYLFHVAMEKGWSWTIIHLLRDITDEDVSPKEHWGKFCHMASDWLQWYLKSDYSKDKGVYYGLIDDTRPPSTARYETEVKGKRLVVTEADMQDVTVLIAKINDAGGQVGSGHDIATLWPGANSKLHKLELVSYVGGPTWLFTFEKVSNE